VAKLRKIEKHVLVCEHKDCEKRGGRDAYKSLKGALKEAGLRERVMVSRVGCFDQCDDGPVVVVYPEGVWYGRVDERGAAEIVARQVAEGRPAGCKVLRDLREPPAGG
jgi:(2Fe-2S) ferredoxin